MSYINYFEYYFKVITINILSSLLIHITSSKKQKTATSNEIINYTSKTNYLIDVNLAKFKVNIFTGSKGNWKLINSYKCTIGKPSTPTPKGVFTIGIKGLFFGVEKGYKCRYYTQFKGNYLFHSIIYNLNGSVKDGRLGMRLSDGCIRLALQNAKWIYDNIPQGSTVVIR